MLCVQAVQYVPYCYFKIELDEATIPYGFQSLQEASMPRPYLNLGMQMHLHDYHFYDLINQIKISTILPSQAFLSDSLF